MMVYLPESNQLVVTDGEASGVQLVDCTRYKIIKKIKLKPDVDHGVLDPVNKYYYVESGGGSNAPTHFLSIIDTKSFKHVGDVEGLPGSSSEGMVIDRAGKKLYVNLTGTDEVGVIDLATRQLVARWALPDAHAAHAMVPELKRLYVAVSGKGKTDARLELQIYEVQ